MEAEDRLHRGGAGRWDAVMAANLALLVAVSFAWAAGYLFIGAASKLPALTATAIMTAIAATILLFAVRFGLGRNLMGLMRQRAWVPMVMGLTAIGLPNLAVVYAQHRITPDLAALLGVTVPITTLFITTFVTRETPFSAVRMAGAAVAVLGLYVFLGADDLDDLPALFSMGVMMAGGVVFAINGVFVARQTRDLDEYVLTTWTVVFGAVALGAAAFVFEAPLRVDYTGALWGLIGEGVIGIALAYLGYYMLVARAGANFAAYYAYLVPALALFSTALVYGRAINAYNIAGLVIVLGGLILLTRKDDQAGMPVVQGGTPSQ